MSYTTHLFIIGFNQMIKLHGTQVLPYFHKLKDAKIASFADPKLTKAVKNDEEVTDEQTFNVTTRQKMKKD